jgi:hypothetical protein
MVGTDYSNQRPHQPQIPELTQSNNLAVPTERLRTETALHNAYGPVMDLRGVRNQEHGTNGNQRENLWAWASYFATESRNGSAGNESGRLFRSTVATFLIRYPASESTNFAGFAATRALAVTIQPGVQSGRGSPGPV